MTPWMVLPISIVSFAEIMQSKEWDASPSDDVGRDGAGSLRTGCSSAALGLGAATGDYVIFIGDGLRSDACAAEKADTVFARSRLLKHCKENGIEAIAFDDFYPIARHISGLDLGHNRPGAVSGRVAPPKAVE